MKVKKREIFESFIIMFLGSIAFTLIVLVATLLISKTIVPVEEKIIYETSEPSKEVTRQVIYLEDENIVEETETEDIYGLDEREPEFKVLKTKCNNWKVSDDYQKMIWDACEKYDVNYLMALSICYNEFSLNDPYATNINSNGSVDRGIMQINDIQADIVKLVTKCEDLDVLYNPWPNIRTACYILSKYSRYEGVETIEDCFMCYNGGYNGFLQYKEGKKTTEWKAYEYAQKALGNLQLLYNEYYNE